MTAKEEQVVRIVCNREEVHIDALTRELEFDPGEMSKIMLMLEMKGIVKQLPGMYYCLASSF